jgi:hypothetical protein
MVYHIDGKGYVPSHAAEQALECRFGKLMAAIDAANAWNTYDNKTPIYRFSAKEKNETEELEKAYDRCVFLGIAVGGTQCIDEMIEVLTTCLQNFPPVNGLIPACVETHAKYEEALDREREVEDRDYDNSSPQVGAARKAWLAAERAFDEKLNAILSIVSEIFLSLEAEKNVEKGCKREAYSVQYKPLTPEDAEIFDGFAPFFKLFGLVP